MEIRIRGMIIYVSRETSASRVDVLLLLLSRSFEPSHIDEDKWYRIAVKIVRIVHRALGTHTIALDAIILIILNAK